MKKPDCILSYHVDTALCGVAKFNAELGRRLNIPVYSLFSGERPCGYPLVSIKISEFPDTDFFRMLNVVDENRSYQLFLHDKFEGKLVQRAEKVYAANEEIAAYIRPFRPDVVTAWCPPLLTDKTLFKPAGITVFSFGMAHKIQAEYYAKLDQELQETGLSYCLRLSTAFHEGFNPESEFGVVADDIRKVFSGPVYFLGCLSDAAIWNELKTCDYFASFFPKGYRANNTSINAAIEAGVKIVTNCDEYSPGIMQGRDKNGVTVLAGYSTFLWHDLIEMMDGIKDGMAFSDYVPCDVGLD